MAKAVAKKALTKIESSENIDAAKIETQDEAEKVVEKKLTKEELFELEIEKRVAERLAEKQAEIEAQRITSYAASNTLLRDKAFLMRLYMLSVQSRWLPLFRDEDRIMTDDQIWEKIRFSPIDDADKKKKGL